MWKFGRSSLIVLVCSLAAIACSAQTANRSDDVEREALARKSSLSEELDPDQWKRVDTAVDRGLAYLASQQQVDGSIAAPQTGQPGITALAVMAFLSRGHVPDEGPYGSRLLEAIDFVQNCQREDGLLSLAEVEPSHVHDGASHTGNYNHAIAGLMLTEVYGMVPGERQERLAIAIRRALRFTREQQTKPRNNPREKGGWRYLRPRQGWDADISVTSWQLMFYRSARNAEFEVSKDGVDEALEYIRRGFDARQQTFTYNLPGGANLATRGVAGGAIVSLALGGEHHSEQAPAPGSCSIRSSNTTAASGRITTALTIAARECFNWAATTGGSSFRRSPKRSSPTSRPTAPGIRRTTTTAIISDVATPRRFRFWRSLPPTSCCPFSRSDELRS